MITTNTHTHSCVLPLTAPPQHHLKKMEGRRLDFDYKKKRQGKVQEDEIKQALEKFDESKEIAEQSMFNLLESDVRPPPRLYFERLSSIRPGVASTVHQPGAVRFSVIPLQIEQVSQLAALVQAQLEYHSRTAQILQQLSSKMDER